MPLAASDLTVRYGPRTALSGFGLQLEPGEVRALIGPNGSGKSTALQALAGLVRPASGRTEIDGRPVTAMSRREVARHLAFLPQQPVAPDEMTVGQLVRQGRFAHVGLFRAYGPQDEAAIAWALDCTGLSNFAERRLIALSGGERQRAWISAALAQEARILLLDEPTSFLDIGYQVEVLDLVHRLSRERGVAVIMAIHDLNQALSIADRISVLKGGICVFDGEPDALAASGLIERVFRVRGRFVDIAPGAPPHFDVDLLRRRGLASTPAQGAQAAGTPSLSP
ncbi:ABC transporter ATP-binding protein [Aureimonas pseudogalii]|uniref:Iron complex transport system ATP-binding protein n=1 Tax=Aureimonas pseudogalii TaxID=1744844 RepID=A0A7W6MMC8_9HYPH|nr:ABC transporter ATP-binding protein [Aureimonas pseudogalii]MBB4000707.1 iron complex transport system ATP-binding protein [Aureimonas pseudogalii]